MLSIGKIALGQHRYYEQQVAQGLDDYYAGRGEAPGEWVGAGALALGLEGRVSGEQFGALVAGMNPAEPGERLRAAECEPRIAALDLTFSAPKSLSVLFALAPPEVSGALVDAHEEAVRASLSWLEGEALWVRRGHAGARLERGGGLVAAAYRHRMSRALDPQLHTHVVAGNLARGADGRYTALHAAPLYRAAKTAGFLYQAHLRALVSERLGLDWGPVSKGAAQLLGVPEGVSAEFSQRRQAMLRAAECGGIGLGTKAAAESAAIATRERKQYGVETHSWRERIAARASEHGLDHESVEQVIAEGRERLDAGALEQPVDERELSERLAGEHGLTERANCFDERPVLQAFAAAARQGARVEQVRDQGERFAARSDVLETVGGEMTTADLVACERRLIAAAVGRMGEGCGLLDERTVSRGLARSDRRLNAEQRSAVRASVLGGHGVAVIEALAGTGKTHTAGAIGELYADAGYHVLGVAPTGRAARELSDQAGIPARTLERTLIDLEQLGDTLPERCVIVLDEASMAATRPTARLLEHARLSGAKVIAIGDPGQLPSVQAGGWLRAVGERGGAVRLSEVMRQRSAGERRALAALHDANPDAYLAWAERSGRIELPGPGQHVERALAEWAAAVTGHGPREAVLIARDNGTRQALNEAAREHRRALGELGSEQRYGALELAVGDRVICRRNDALIDVDNGTRGTVRHLDESQVVLETDSGLARSLPAVYVAEHVELAYCLTGHGMQGATVEHAVVLATPSDLTRGWSYTALSRARGETRLLIANEPTRSEADRHEHAPTTRPRPSGRSELLARVARRMCERDDEDLAIEQLKPAGREDDPQLAAARSARGELLQERATVEAGAGAPMPVRLAWLRETRDRLERLEAQHAALPLPELRSIDRLDQEASEISELHARRAAELAALPAPSRRFGRIRDPEAVERAFLGSVLSMLERQQQTTLAHRARLSRELGDPDQIRSEADGLRAAIRELETERNQLRDELAERDLQRPPQWATCALGERASDPHQREAWERGMRAIARHRIEYDLSDQDSPLGPEPPAGNERRAWERAQQELDRAQRRLGREDRSRDRDVDLGWG